MIPLTGLLVILTLLTSGCAVGSTSTTDPKTQSEGIQQRPPEGGGGGGGGGGY